MKRIALIVEDDVNIQEILTDYLINEGGFDQVHLANDGVEGYQKAMSIQYDLITLDHSMPYRNGTELLAAIRQKQGPNKQTTIFFVSALIPVLPQELRDSPDTFYIEKPIDFNRLLNYIKISMRKSA